MNERGELVNDLFKLGLSQQEMLVALAHNGYIISQRHLRRILVSQSLRRRKNYSDIGDVIRLIQKEMSHSGRLHGYRWMWEKCLQNGLKVKRDDVQQILTILDPDSTAFRYFAIQFCNFFTSFIFVYLLITQCVVM
jgi:glutamine phosphoribosylpyrophosphate amidotransferase